MCSFLFTTNYKNQEINHLNYYLKFRGPDYTNHEILNNNLHLHNLLSITGKFTPQPYKQDGIVLLYNGEIYNFKDFGDYSSDGECLIPLYLKYGEEFIKKLDGEFALCLIDYNKEIIILSSDIFKTKPLFYSFDDNNFGCSSYRTPLDILNHKNVKKAEPNKTLIISLKTYKILHEYVIQEFDLNQHKTSYEDWIYAFRKAIIKRTDGLDKQLFIGLSSGYDSGLIFNELLKINKDFYSFTLKGTENEDILKQRFELKNKNSKCYSTFKTDELYYNSHEIIKKNTEEFKYTIHSDTSNYNEYTTSLINDAGSNNFATICRMAKQKDCKVCLSGTGADEIISDYGFNGTKIYNHSNFGGFFPKDLKKIFPWASFYGSTLESYIAKEEYVGGSFGIEMRYPFLDKNVVQEFLWLSDELKNKEYKAPIDYYFNLNKFPYSKLEKKGF